MKRIQKNSLMSGALLLLVLLSVSQVWARDPVPKVRIQAVNAPYNQAVMLPNGYSFPLWAEDRDDPSGKPLKYRYLIKEAVVSGTSICSRYQYEQHQDELISFDEPGWSPWLEFRLEDGEYPVIATPELEDGICYIIAAQVLDADGTASMDLTYRESVINFRLSSSMFRPVIIMHEQFLGSGNSNMSTDIASGQPLNFWLEADAQNYGGSIASFRYGWDVADPDDPNDPGWAIPAGSATEIQVPEQVFNHGIHSLVCQAVDTFGASRTTSWYLNVIPFVDPENQYSLLFIDQVVDSMSNRWPSADGSIAYDQAQYRDEYWQFLDGSEGVVGFDWERDHLSHYDQVSYEDIVRYKTVMVNARAHSSQMMFNEFRPENGQDKYVWLNPYQVQGGNLFLVGDRSMESFLEVLDYMVPLVFDTDEQYYILNDHNYTVGFGVREDPDGTLYNRGTRMYPFQTAGLSLLDWSVPVGKNIYGRPLVATEDRTARCSGLKAMVLADDFRTHHQIGGAVLADTLYTNQDIDWRDNVSDSLDEEFPFTGDEFVDANISDRTTPWTVQECADGVDGLCLEPMFQGVSRFDWVREKRWAEGDTEWPSSQYSPNELRELCGEMALETLQTPDGEIPNGTARVTGKTYGYLSYKNVASKPSGKADAYWGFDPYRFDQEESKKSVRWVLDYFGLHVGR